MMDVLLLDNFNEDSIMLHGSFKAAGFNGLTIVVDDSGFLPDDVTSLYRFFCGTFRKGKPRYFNQINIPDYWEIEANNTSGKITNLFRKRGSIFYTTPLNNRLVSCVDWYDEDGIVRCSDHYDLNGFLYARTTFNKKGQRFCKSYYDQDNKEIIVENYVTRDIVLNYDGKVFVFNNKVELIKKLFTLANIECGRIFYNSLSTPFFVSESMVALKKGDILFWQEDKRNDVPGNMKVILDGNANRTNLIYVQKKESYKKLMELTDNSEFIKPLGYVYNFIKDNRHTNKALICTNSDQIEQLEYLVTNLENIEFHIVAITEMSSKLLSMGKYDNVHLYPGAKASLIEELFDSCDIYLDINYANEIVDSIKRAFLHNELILSFENTIHNKTYIYPSLVCNDGNKMVKLLKDLLADVSLFDKHLDLQRKYAMCENVDAYKSILNMWEV